MDVAARDLGFEGARERSSATAASVSRTTQQIEDVPTSEEIITTDTPARCSAPEGCVRPYRTDRTGPFSVRIADPAPR